MRVFTSTHTSAARIIFRLAAADDDPALRQLLRDNPMRGSISLSLEREPSYFTAAKVEGANHQTIVGVDTTTNRILCAGAVSMRTRFINGRPQTIGYLSALRFDQSIRGSGAILRQGYRFLHDLHRQQNIAILYLTSIASDNHNARRMLEANLRHMPIYRPLDEFVTLVFPVARASRPCRSPLQIQIATQESVHDIIKCVNHHNAAFQFSPRWTGQDLLSSPNLSLEHFRLAYANDRLVGCSALWDQRPFKQTVIRGYFGALRRTRRLLNFLAPILCTPTLPGIGETVAQAFISHLAVDESDPSTILHLVQSMSELALARGIEYLTLGVSARDPRLPIIRRALRCREYLTQLYTVHWPEDAHRIEPLDDRPAAPEVALL